MNKPEMPKNIIYNPATGKEVPEKVITCRSCKFYNSAFHYAACSAPQLLTKVDYETGEMCYNDRVPYRPQALREHTGYCGPEAKWFQKRTPIKTLFKLIRDMF